jgi:hypothetical protein
MAQDRTGQVWLAEIGNFDRAVVPEERLYGDKETHACLIVEKPDLGAAHVRHPAIDLVTGDRCQLLEESDETWEELIRALARDGAAYMAPVRVT